MELAKPTCDVYTDGGESAEDVRRNEQLTTASSRHSHRLPGQVIYRAMLLNEVVTPLDVQLVKELQLRSDDVLLCGFMRSGTTWLGEILFLLLSNLDFAGMEQKMCYSRMLWLDDKRTHKLVPDFPRPRLMKTHLPPALVPPSAFSEKTRIVLAIRNPKDVAVAAYHFYKGHSHCANFPGSFGEFREMFMDGYVHWGDWRKHVNSWWEAAKTNDTVLPVFYEETKANPREAVRTLAKFLHIDDVTDADVERIVDATSFAKMKASRTTNLEHLNAFSGSGAFIRKGEVGDWKNHFSHEESRQFDAWVESEITDEELLEHLK